MRKIPAFSAAAVLLVLLAGCGVRETPAEAGRRTGTLLVGNQAEPADLDPHTVDAFTEMIVVSALFEGLTVLEERTSRGLPGAAASWETSPEGRTWTFHLRPEARWSNGEPVTAGDFAYAFRRVLTPALGSPSAHLLWVLRGARDFHEGRAPDFGQVGVAAVDDRTLRLHLAHPVPYLPTLVAHPAWYPVHRATLERFEGRARRGTAWTRPGNLVGNGAFTLAEWRPQARIAVARNPTYWDAARTRLQRVEFLPLEQPGAEEHAFRAGQLHVTFDLPASRLGAYREAADPRLRVDPLLNTWYLNLNVRRPPLDRPAVRRALALAIDRAALSRAVYSGARAPAGSFVPPGCGEYAPVAGTRADPEAARRLLAEAGFPEGRGLPAIPLLARNDGHLPKVAEAIQEMWRQIGITATIEVVEQKTWLEQQQQGAHTAALLGWVADYADPLTFLGLFVTGGGNNWTGWADATYDGLLAEARETADPAARAALLRRAETRLLEEAPVSPLVHGAQTYLLDPAVRGWEPAPLGLHRFHRVELAPP